ncbi:MAG: translation initiation factor [Candidatus Parvarchaeota archaeon]|nr:translation initiation factor [Candidatus Jingweiarchaeum tengchongense]MCW1297797.1 translation initiation factor [Candidatus Jingweiarchaeum tengchongense]MCW1299807.1 translation initiation factor [Candidatus Jingweiarchaeum tengchongense]MCW1304222.1 translation initiation factor [Candidatus Jingweiarchaeum tengchongense]MCW1305250.1 translation initiation factor [Candidatus Jingweiarchaeum tengchongense]
MSETCPKCGLPKDICACEIIAKEQTKIMIKLEKKRFGKFMTVISGIDTKQIDLKEIVKKMKTELACGGTIKNNTLELQGDHRKKAKEILVKLGFAPETIEVS